MLIATDPLSLVFITCFLIGLLFLLVTALLGNLGHGHATGVHTGGQHFHLHVGGHAAGTHATGHAVGTHAAGHGPTHDVGHATSGQHATTQGASQGVQGGGNPFSSLFSYVNITTIILFLLGFGFFGYVFHNTVHLVAQIALVLAVVGGIAVSTLMIVLLTRLFGDSEGETIQDVADRTGLLGKVSIPIQENGLGEVIYVSPGGMRKSVPARSADGRRLERDQEVVVVNYQNGVAEVETWDRFLEEEQAVHGEAPVSDDDLEKLRSLLYDTDRTDTQLVMRKDPQKE